MMMRNQGVSQQFLFIYQAQGNTRQPASYNSTEPSTGDTGVQGITQVAYSNRSPFTYDIQTTVNYQTPFTYDVQTPVKYRTYR